MPSPGQTLTSPDYWDEYWERRALPSEMKTGQSLHGDELIKMFERYLPNGRSRTALEIGGAPGGYLAFMHRKLGYEITVLDYSERGCQMASENFDLLKIPASVVCGDMFDAAERLPRFDLVYSLGLIEHFSDPAQVVEAHLRYIKPGGTLMIGCPNFLGLNRVIVSRLAPSLLSSLETEATSIDSWSGFDSIFGLSRAFLGYLGGFEPLVAGRCESVRIRDRGLWFALGQLAKVLNHPATRALRRLNSRLWSGYLLGIYTAREEVSRQ
jgi:2-polyprenyl-3-methyl-5-hydroxy-6-metoxy-1,4-benzoquinol methylase